MPPTTIGATRPHRRRSESPDVDTETVIGLLDDDDTRCILTALEEPRTAQEIMAACDIPRSTAYRKLDELADAGLVEQRIRPSVAGNHASEYARSFDGVHIHITEENAFEVALAPRTGPA